MADKLPFRRWRKKWNNQVRCRWINKSKKVWTDVQGEHVEKDVHDRRLGQWVILGGRHRTILSWMEIKLGKVDRAEVVWMIKWSSIELWLVLYIQIFRHTVLLVQVTFYSIFSVNICTGHIVHQNGLSNEGDTGIWIQSDTEKYCEDTEEHWDYKGALGRGRVVIWWPLLCLDFVHTDNKKHYLCPVRHFSEVVICYYCHLRTKTCDHIHTKIRKLRTFSIILHFSWQTNTWHRMLLIPQHNVCVCVCAHIHNMRTSESDKRRPHAHSWQSASTSFRVIQCERCLKYENKISWAQLKSCPSYFKL